MTQQTVDDATSTRMQLPGNGDTRKQTILYL